MSMKPACPSENSPVKPLSRFIDTHKSEYIAPFLSTGMSISVSLLGLRKLSSANRSTYSATSATIVSHIP